jgi:preprotein translocase subunit YajC
MKTKTFVILVLLIVLVGGAIAGAFLGGQAVGKSQGNQASQSRFSQLPSGQRRAYSSNLTSPGGTVFTRGGTFGTVEKIEGNMLTVKAPDGSTVQVVISDQTTIQKMAQGDLNDITIGSSVSVTGDRKSDGSVAATTIFITPNPTAQ